LVVCVEQLILGHAYDEYLVLAKKPGMTSSRPRQLALDLSLDDLALDLDALGLGLKIVTMMEPEKKAASHPRQEVAPRRKAASHPRKELTGNL
jgi:hypothetical protein